MVVSELAWVKPDRLDEIRANLEAEYPAIKNIEENMCGLYVSTKSSWARSHKLILFTSRIAALKRTLAR